MLSCVPLAGGENIIGFAAFQAAIKQAIWG